MKVLNLYAGLGGNRKLWKDCQITAVEQNEQIASVYKSLYPGDELIIGDAHQFLLDNHSDYDVVWSSPPCQSHSRMMKATRHKKKFYPDLSLYQEIIFLQHFFKGKWVVENVKPYYDPLIKPTAIIGRHYFWSNISISGFYVPELPSFINGTNNVEKANELKKWLGIEYEGNIYYKGNHCPGQVLRNCVHPELGNHVFGEIFKAIEATELLIYNQ